MDFFTSEKSMTCLRMSFGDAISMALLFLSYVARMTDTDCSSAEQAVCSLADVTHVRRFKLAIRSSNPHWYSAGMRISAYKYNGTVWRKRALTWAIMHSPSRVFSTEDYEGILRVAFGKWAAVEPNFTFTEVSPSQQPDIRVEFIRLHKRLMSYTSHTRGRIFDFNGATILFNNTINWTDVNGADWCNFRFSALHEIGHALGLDDTQNPKAVMYEGNVGFMEPGDPELREDDIVGLQFLYGGSPSSRQTTQTPSLPPPRLHSSSSSSSSTISSSDDDDSDARNVEKTLCL